MGPCIGTMAFLLGLFALVAYPTWRRERDRTRALLAIPLADLAPVRDGDRVRVVGVITAGESLLEAPGDGGACVFYSSHFAWRGGAGHRAHAVPFWIGVDGSWVRIEAQGAHFTTRPGKSSRLVPADARPTLRLELEVIGKDFATPPSPEERMRYLETRVQPGEHVTVVGNAAWVETTALQSTMYRGGQVPKRVLLLGPSREERVFVSI